MPDVPQPLILAQVDLRTPDGQDFWTTPEMWDPVHHYPTFAVHEVAKCFFGMSPGWLRSHLRSTTSTLLDEESVFPLRTTSGARMFRLWDIERLAHAFAVNRVITGRQLELTVMMVKTAARLHQFIA